MFSRGSRVEPNTAADFVKMQNTANDLGFMNISGSPEGVVPANPGSLACDRTNGRLYQKVSGVGNTGWQQIPAGGDIPESFVTNTGTATPAGGIINFVVGTASTTSGAGNTVTLPQGNVVGPALSTDNAVVRYDLATGLLIQNSGVTITDADVCNGITQLNVDNLRLDGNTVSSTDTNGAINLAPDGTGNVSLTKSTAGVASTYLASQTNNSNTSSNAEFRALVGGASGGDPFISVGIESVASYCFGLDNTDSDALKVAFSAGSNTNPSLGTTLLKCTSSGEITMPLQPAFAAYFASTAANISGNGTTYILGDTDVGGGVSMTEIFDQGGDFVTGGASGAIFTAPVTGRYSLSSALLCQQTTTANDIDFVISTSNRAWRAWSLPVAVSAVSNMGFNMTVFADMDSADTAVSQVTINGIGADTADIYGGASDARSWFSGYLEC